MTDTTQGNLYDYPRYYDLVYGSDWKAEFDFLIECFQKYAGRAVQRVFEPACGTGRLLFRLARVDYRVAGLDLNERAVAYCNARLARWGYPASALVGDMADFRLARKVDAAFNMINSFRHLRSEREARNHLQCVADALYSGGIYVLGLHLTPTEGEPLEEESWSARRGHLCVNTRMWLTQRNLRRREERFGMTYDVYTPRQSFQLADEIVFRTYTAAQLRTLLASVPAWEVAETYDFSYRIDAPIEIGPESEDVVLVLRKRRGEK